MSEMTGDILESRLRPSADAVDSQVGDETVILHLQSATYYGLDAVGTRIWELLKQGLAPLQICEAISAEFDVEEGVAQSDARDFLRDLKDRRIVEEA